MVRKEEGSLPWARYHEKVGKNATTPPPRPREEEPNTTHRILVRQDLIPVVPFALGLLFITGLIEGCVEGPFGDSAVDRPIPGAPSQPSFLTGFLACPFAISICKGS